MNLFAFTSEKTVTNGTKTVAKVAYLTTSIAGRAWKSLAT